VNKIGYMSYATEHNSFTTQYLLQILQIIRVYNKCVREILFGIIITSAETRLNVASGQKRKIAPPPPKIKIDQPSPKKTSSELITPFQPLTKSVILYPNP
jgi:hypothetical protein